MHEYKSPRTGIIYKLGHLRDQHGNPKTKNLYVFWSEGNRSKRVTTGAESSAEAQAFLAEFILDREAPVKKTCTEMTLQAVFEDYLAEHGPALVNLKRAELSRDRLTDYFGSVAVSHITQPNIRAYIKWRRDAEIKDSTINRELVMLRASLRHAVKEDRLESAPPYSTLERATCERCMANPPGCWEALQRI